MSLKSKMDQKTCWGFVPILHGTETRSLSRASFVVSSRQVVPTRENLGHGWQRSFSKRVSRRVVSPNSARLHVLCRQMQGAGGDLPYSHPADLLVPLTPSLESHICSVGEGDGPRGGFKIWWPKGSELILMC